MAEIPVQVTRPGPTSPVVARPGASSPENFMQHTAHTRVNRIRLGISGWLVAAALLVPAWTAAQEKPAAEWDTTKARGATREIDFDTSEGTWMSLDASPDGKWIIFDLLGHVYRVPATGGKAECLTQNSGIALNQTPHFSPDGKTIAFISDRKGQNNLWLMDADGKNPRSVYIDNTKRALSVDF
jgi:hypothetical protein